MNFFGTFKITGFTITHFHHKLRDLADLIRVVLSSISAGVKKTKHDVHMNSHYQASHKYILRFWQLLCAHIHTFVCFWWCLCVCARMHEHAVLNIVNSSGLFFFFSSSSSFLPAILVNHSGSFREKKARQRSEYEASKNVIYQWVIAQINRAHV